MVYIRKNGQVNGKTAYLVQRRACGSTVTVASIVFDGQDWVLKRLAGARVDRFETAGEAKDEARKG